MNELIDVMNSILSELQEMNGKLDEIKGFGLYNSIADICDKLDQIQGNGLYNSITDICDKLDSVESSIGNVELAINLHD